MSMQKVVKTIEAIEAALASKSDAKTTVDKLMADLEVSAEHQQAVDQLIAFIEGARASATHIVDAVRAIAKIIDEAKAAAAAPVKE